MKIHTTDYQNTFIEVAADCPVKFSEAPPSRKTATAGEIQYEMIRSKPYHYSSDDVVFEVFARKKDLTDEERDNERAKFFSKGQPCLRSSVLCKRYGFGIHHNHESKIAIFSTESEEYTQFLKDDSVHKVKAMRSKRN
ncbi:hypothetical protein ASG31_04250 [Chryseobacterium sp. Leaf404]|uniref:DUF6157 family protein n=1 Tax=unclassified Chryseobacterium TaxID=2593645 RepID=UPI0006F3BE5A|nr:MULTISPECIES: DUF6157 family protein [unclassified Chryseobacterium]KQT17956.1 hypothetical protein ASG31_04250 [Chryseobacterium sp. Leaf404]